jgi:predicted Zn-dependent protease
LRENRPQEAESLLAELVSEFPENPLFHRELARARELARGNRPPAPVSGSGAR